MKLLIMSDTHGDAEVISRVCSYYPEAEAVIHCGDSELPYDHEALEGIERVRGNCDHGTDFPEEKVFQIDRTTIFVTHGHLFNVKSSILSLTYRAKELGADICCFGHSHILGAEKINNTLFINPGSLLKPRGREEKTFVVVEIEEASYVVNCYTDDHELLKTMRFER
ncbi:metallophosphoesterase [Lysinibacillus odysseyi]|uniref:Phosphoesterase n=1 Tax=Lysinibacillus odysseyi 34hs-1 = NBRC 100172 TaxID=1220589 RepID=A0A0A3IIR9_9BACI|nr:metallophosphoesterase [Lysinibacillus odysseyi]KGR83330.1 metallophosphatase [Lysinibacillus odysseyi 34hs-1 = NBRC 100172]